MTRNAPGHEKGRRFQDQRGGSDIAMSKYRKLLLGDSAPLFRQRSTGGQFFDTSPASGRYYLLCFSSRHQMLRGKRRCAPSGTTGGFMTMQSSRSSASRSIRKTNAKRAESSSRR